MLNSWTTSKRLKNYSRVFWAQVKPVFFFENSKTFRVFLFSPAACLYNAKQFIIPISGTFKTSQKTLWNCASATANKPEAKSKDLWIVARLSKCVHSCYIILRAQGHALKCINQAISLILSHHNFLLCFEILHNQITVSIVHQVIHWLKLQPVFGRKTKTPLLNQRGCNDLAW